MQMVVKILRREEEKKKKRQRQKRNAGRWSESQTRGDARLSDAAAAEGRKEGRRETRRRRKGNMPVDVISPRDQRLVNEHARSTTPLSGGCLLA